MEGASDLLVLLVWPRQQWPHPRGLLIECNVRLDHTQEIVRSDWIVIPAFNVNMGLSSRRWPAKDAG